MLDERLVSRLYGCQWFGCSYGFAMEMRRWRSVEDGDLMRTTTTLFLLTDAFLDSRCRQEPDRWIGLD